MIEKIVKEQQLHLSYTYALLTVKSEEKELCACNTEWTSLSGSR